MYLMLQQEEPADYVIATGESYSLAGNPTLAWEKLGWRATYQMLDIVKMMIEAGLNV